MNAESYVKKPFGVSFVLQRIVANYIMYMDDFREKNFHPRRNSKFWSREIFRRRSRKIQRILFFKGKANAFDSGFSFSGSRATSLWFVKQKIKERFGTVCFETVEGLWLVSQRIHCNTREVENWNFHVSYIMPAGYS